MLGVNEKLDEIKQLHNSGLISKEEYFELRAKALGSYEKMPESLQQAYREKTSEPTKSNKKAGCLLFYIAFFIFSFIVGMIIDCGASIADGNSPDLWFIDFLRGLF